MMLEVLLDGSQPLVLYVCDCNFLNTLNHFEITVGTKAALAIAIVTIYISSSATKNWAVFFAWMPYVVSFGGIPPLLLSE